MTGALRKSCPLISIYRDTRGMDHVHLRPLCPKPVRQPETSGHLLLFGPPGGGQSGFALVENGGLKYVKSGMLRRLYDLLD